MYMSYCRMEGTHAELKACFNDVEEHIYEEAERRISESEIQHFRGMVFEFYDFLSENDLLDNEGNLKKGEFNELCEKLKKTCYD